jgi:hypothetical protein
MYTWHITFDQLPSIPDLAARAQARLTGLPGLDLVPGRWLHLTTQGVGFTDTVTDADIATIIAAARNRLAPVEPPAVTVGPARVASEGIAFPVLPAGALTPLRTALRSAIADVWSPDTVPEAADWSPHVSVAYSRVSGPDDAYEAALHGEADTEEVTIRSAQLIVLGRDNHMYEWTTMADVPLT